MGTNNRKDYDMCIASMQINCCGATSGQRYMAVLWHPAAEGSPNF